MADLRSRLERIGERVRTAPDAFERLERARRRHERNRRITAGIVALSVAVAGSLIAFSAFRSGDAVQTAGSGGSNEDWSVEPTGVSGPTAEPMNAWDALCATARAGDESNVHNGADLRVDGRDAHFDTRCLIAPAGRPVTILFSNLDGGIQRNISIYRLTPYLRECIVTGTSPGGPDALGRALFSGELITGVDEVVYELGRFESGEYYFQDDEHPEANGVLVVE